jgi:Outer membrane protein beta-barrel domain
MLTPEISPLDSPGGGIDGGPDSIENAFEIDTLTEGGKMKKLGMMAVAGALAGLLFLPMTSSAAEMRGGLKIGLNLADLNGADIATFETEFGAPWKSKLAFCGGGFITFSLSKTMAIQAEALYTMKGARLETTVDTQDVEVSWNTSYLEIPVLFKLMIPAKGRIQPSLFAGPALAIKLSGKLKVEAGGASAEQSIPGIKSTDLGLVLGAGADIGLKIRVDLRYTLGLTKMIEIDGVTSDIKNGVFSLMVGYAF